MADIKLGNNTTVYKVGSGDCTIYLGTTLLYPHTTPFKFSAQYNDSSSYSAACDSSSASIGKNDIAVTNLVSVEIGDCVTSIDDQVLMNGTGLTAITVNATTPPTLGRWALGNTNDCPIYVPSGSVNTYKAASGWSAYASRIQAITS